ncbi:hypothetical protein BF95_11740 [Sphingobium sp. Ant17]|nr:hypothetical protein BF95_11740 [Sphingobium sp. Ant17]
MAIGKLGVLLLEVSAVRQKKFAQGFGGPCAENGSIPAETRHARQSAGMIEMRMGQQHQVDVGDLGRNGRPVEAAQVPRPLEQAGIYDDLRLAVIHQVTRARDGLRCAEEGDAETVGRTLRKVDLCLALEHGRPQMGAGPVFLLSLVHEFWLPLAII